MQTHSSLRPRLMMPQGVASRRSQGRFRTWTPGFTPVWLIQDKLRPCILQETWRTTWHGTLIPGDATSPLLHPVYLIAMDHNTMESPIHSVAYEFRTRLLSMHLSTSVRSLVRYGGWCWHLLECRAVINSLAGSWSKHSSWLR